jgi:hypothetical protein
LSSGKRSFLEELIENLQMNQINYGQSIAISLFTLPMIRHRVYLIVLAKNMTLLCSLVYQFGFLLIWDIYKKMIVCIPVNNQKRRNFNCSKEYVDALHWVQCAYNY